jgi:hypothetical protein
MESVSLRVPGIRFLACSDSQGPRATAAEKISTRLIFCKCFNSQGLNWAGIPLIIDMIGDVSLKNSTN